MTGSLGRYRIERELGRGAMGQVLRAWDPVLGRAVAIKRLRGLGDHELLLRFEREARAAARLSHPGIVGLHEVGRDERGHPFLVLELVEGETLQERLARGPLRPEVAAALVHDLAAAVAHAHDHGVLHRDLKPANVLLRPDGRPCLADFGLAGLHEGGAQRLTTTGALVGTPAYMSPEQARGDRDAVGVESDVYGLGAVLFACLTGGAPFSTGDAFATLHAVLHEPPPSPRARRPEVPRELDAICRRALAKDPAERFATARALGAALAQSYAGVRRRRRVLPAGVALAAALALGVAVGLVQARREAAPPRPPALDRRAAAAELARFAQALNVTLHGPADLGLSSLACRLDPGCGSAWLEHANALAAVERYAEAEPAARRAERLGADPAGVANLIGVILFQLHRGDEAYAWLHRATFLRPDQITYALNLASSLRQQGRPREAAALFDDLLPRAAGSRLLTSVVRERAMGLAQAGEQVEEALAALRGLERDGWGSPRSRRVVQLHIGLAEAARGDLAAAIAAFSEAVAPGPGPLARDEQAICYFRRGELRKQRGELEAAREDYREALARADSPIPARALAETLQRLGRPTEAAAALSDHLERVGGDAQLWEDAARTWSRAGQAARGLAVARGGLEAHPDSVRLGFMVAQAQVRSGDPAGGLALLARLDPAGLEAEGLARIAGPRLEADARSALGDQAGAIATLERALQRSPGDPTLETDLACYYLAVGQPARVDGVLARPYPAAEEESRRLLLLGLSLLARDQPVEAEAHLRRSRDLLPNPYQLAWHARCLIALGREEEAWSVLTDLTEREPTALTARLLLVPLALQRGQVALARTRAEEATRFAPEESLGWRLLAEARAAAGDPAGAEQARAEQVVRAAGEGRLKETVNRILVP